MENTCIVWGKQHGIDTLIKLYRDTNLKRARAWMEKSRKYYNEVPYRYGLF